MSRKEGVGKVVCCCCEEGCDGFGEIEGKGSGSWEEYMFY